MQEDQIALHQQQQEMEVNRVMGQYALTRVKCLLRWYQRTRLQKIEKHVMWILDEPEVHTRLSPQVGPSTTQGGRHGLRHRLALRVWPG